MLVIGHGFIPGEYLILLSYHPNQVRFTGGETGFGNDGDNVSFGIRDDDAGKESFSIYHSPIQFISIGFQLFTIDEEADIADGVKAAEFDFKADFWGVCENPDNPIRPHLC